MKTSDVNQRMKELGQWNSHNIKLVSDEGDIIWTKPEEKNGNKKLMRDTCQLIQDVFGDIKELSFLDLGAMEGLHGLNIASMEAKVYMVEGKKDNCDKISFARDALKIYGCVIENNDVGKIKVVENKFDIILCFGLIYLFDVPEVFHVIENLYQICNKGLIIDAVFENDDYGFISIEHENELYQGNWRNNDPSAYNSSLEHKKSWHFTSESLRRFLDKVGFTTVYDREYPDSPENKRTFLCIKGEKLDKLPMEK